MAVCGGVLTVGSLFSGIGGFDLGLERAGLRVAWQCEKDEAARRVLARRWPNVPCYPDVKDLDGRAARVDVLCGGFPCQDLSVAGRRAGLAGERSGLFHEFMRVAAELAPRWVLVENVPGLLSSNDGRDMGVVLGVLADLGYGWCYRVLDAQFFGVAQRRRRVFIVGCLGDAGRAAQVLFESDCCDGNPPPSRETGTRTAATLTGGSATGRGVNPPGRRQEDDYNLVSALTANGVGTCGADDNQAQAGHIIPALTARYGKGTDSDASDALLPMAFMWQAGGKNDASGAHEHDFTPTMPRNQTIAVAYPLAMRGRDDGAELEMGDPDLYNALRAGDGGSRRANWVLRTSQTGANGDNIWRDRTPSLQANEPAPAVCDGMAVRRLMPVECERLQGFPDQWTDGETDSARYRMLGNAICVPVSQWIGTHLLAAAVKAEVA